MSEKPWVKLYSEDYEDCLVGNKEGLALLQNALGEVLESPENDLPAELETDFHGILISDRNYKEPEKSYTDHALGWFFGTLLLIWLLALPILGIIFIGKFVF